MQRTIARHCDDIQAGSVPGRRSMRFGTAPALVRLRLPGRHVQQNTTMPFGPAGPEGATGQCLDRLWPHGGDLSLQ